MSITATVKMPIVAVTIMAGKALITRHLCTGSTEIGAEKIAVDDLPLLTDEGSIRVAVHGAELAQVSSKIIPAREENETSETIVALQAKKDTLSDLITWRKNEIERLSSEELQLSEEGNGDVRGWLAFTAARGQLVEEHIAALADLDSQLVDVKNELQEALNQKKCVHYPATRQLEIIFKGPLTQNTELTVTYQVKGACWQPGYALRIAANGKCAQLELFANIAQLTGEDWPSVPVCLSASDIRRSTKLPKLNSWHIGRPRKSESGWRSLPEDSTHLLDNYREFTRAYQAIENTTPVPVPAPHPPIPEPCAADCCEEVVEESSAPRPSRRSLAKISGRMRGMEDCCRESAPMMAARMPVPMPAPSGGAASQAMMGMAMPSMAMRGASMVPGGMSAIQGKFSAGSIPGTQLLDYNLLEMVGPDAPNGGALVSVAGNNYGAQLNQQLNQVDQWLAGHQLKTPTAFLAAYNGHTLQETPADGHWYRVSIGTFDLTLTMEYWSIPRLEKTVFRCGQLPNTTGLPLLAGPLEVYWDNQLLTSTTLPATAVAGAIAVPLGLEERIKVERHVDHKENQIGLLTSTTNYYDEVAISLLSSLGQQVTVRVLDRMPVSYRDTVKVTLGHTEPAPADFPDYAGNKLAAGCLGWAIDCPPGEKQLLKFSYTIELPAKQEVVGGGQRA